LRLVQGLGHTPKPGFVALLAWLPSFVLTPLLWVAGRTRAVKDLGEFGPAEVRVLIDAMADAAQGKRQCSFPFAHDLSQRTTGMRAIGSSRDHRWP
jgi:hypothetical protein